MSSSVLVLRVTDELPPEEWRIVERSAEIGRLPTSTIPLAHRSVSREHAHISREGDQYMVEDLGSKNGTWLNDQQVKGPMALSTGDMLLIGDVPLQVEVLVPDEPHATTPAAPAPLPPPPTPVNRAAPSSTVMVQLVDVLPEGSIGRQERWDETPSTHLDSPTPQPITPTPPSPAPRPRPVIPPPAPVPVEHATVFAPLPVEAEFVEVSEPAPIGAASEPAAATLARLAVSADKLAAALRTFSGDLATAVWLFEHAGGREAAQAFIDCVNAAYLHPEDPLAQRAVLDEAPTAARLLQTAMQVINGLLPLEVEAADGWGNEPQTNTTELEPITRR
jgi:pSer/pThr/pTyr-binding forkhead associated (FHA) protein